MSVFRGASVGLVLTANKSKYSKELREAKAELKAWQKTVDDGTSRVKSAFGTVAKAGAASLGVGLALGIKAGVDELNDMQKASAQTSAVLKSTGGSANVTQKQVESLAQALLRKTGIDDQVVQSGENMLLTFTNVRNEAGKGNDVFTQATTTLLDMSTALGTDASKSAIQLGKALNDPIKGVTALKKVGVTFDDQQKKQIKTLVDHGKTLQAQKIILAELNKEFGGSAAGFGDTAAGEMAKAREAVSGIAAEIVQQGLPAFLDLTKSAATALSQFDEWTRTDAGRQALGEVSHAAEQAAEGIKKVGEAALGSMHFLAEHGDASRAAAGALAGLLVAREVGEGIEFASSAFNVYTAKIVQAARASEGVSVATNLAKGGIAALGGPIGIASLAITGLAGAWLYQKNKQHEAIAEAKNAAAAMYEQTRAAGALLDSQIALASARLGVKEQTAAVKQSEDALAAAQRAHDPAAIEAATLTLSRAKIGLAQSQREAARTAQTENAKQQEAVAGAQSAAAKLNEIAQARRNVRRLETAWISERNPQIAAVDAQELQQAQAHLGALTRNEQRYRDTVTTLRNQGRGAVELIDGKWVVKSGHLAAVEANTRIRMAKQGNTYAAAELAKYAGMVKPAMDAAVRQVKRPGEVKLDRGTLLANLAAPFAGIGTAISQKVGRIPVHLDAFLKMDGFSFGAGDAFDAGGLPPGVVPSLSPFAAIGQKLGLSIPPGGGKRAPGTRTASGGISDHSTGHAIDLGGSKSSMREMAQIARRMPRVKQVIYSPLGLSNGGGPFGPIGNSAVERMHYSHVHVAAYQRGGFRVPGSGDGDTYPAMLEPDEVVVNKRFARQFPGGPAGLHAATNLAVPRFATGGGKFKPINPMQPFRSAKAQAAIDASAYRQVQQAQALYNAAFAQLKKIEKGGVTKKEREAYTAAVEKLRTQAQDLVSKQGALKQARTDTAKQSADDARQQKIDLATANGHLDLAGAQSAAATAADPTLARDAAQQRYDAASAATGVSAASVASLTAQRAAAKKPADQQRIQKLLNAETAHLADLREKQEAAATDLVSAQSAFADEQKRQRDLELAAPKTALTLTDAMLNLQKAQAESTKSLDDDIQERKDALTAEATRQAEIQKVLDRTDLTDEERADALNQMAASVSAVTSLTTEVADLAKQQADAAGAATLDDVLTQLKTATQALFDMGATEAGNVFKIAKLEQVVQGGSVDYWALQTAAALQGAS